MLVDMAVEQGIEYELGIALVIAHLRLIGEPFAFLLEGETDGVDAGAVVVE